MVSSTTRGTSVENCAKYVIAFSFSLLSKSCNFRGRCSGICNNPLLSFSALLGSKEVERLQVVELRASRILRVKARCRVEYNNLCLKIASLLQRGTARSPASLDVTSRALSGVLRVFALRTSTLAPTHTTAITLRTPVTLACASLHVQTRASFSLRRHFTRFLKRMDQQAAAAERNASLLSYLSPTKPVAWLRGWSLRKAREFFFSLLEKVNLGEVTVITCDGRKHAFGSTKQCDLRATLTLRNELSFYWRVFTLWDVGFGGTHTHAVSSAAPFSEHVLCTKRLTVMLFTASTLSSPQLLLLPLSTVLNSLACLNTRTFTRSMTRVLTRVSGFQARHLCMET